MILCMHIICESKSAIHRSCYNIPFGGSFVGSSKTSSVPRPLSDWYYCRYSKPLVYDDYDLWDWARGTDSSVLFLEAHRFVTWNQRQTVDLSVVVRLRQTDKRSVSPFSL